MLGAASSDLGNMYPAGLAPIHNLHCHGHLAHTCPKVKAMFHSMISFFCSLSYVVHNQIKLPASVNRFAKLLQSRNGAGSLAGELTASLKLLTVVGVLVDDATGDLLLGGCD